MSVLTGSPSTLRRRGAALTLALALSGLAACSSSGTSSSSSTSTSTSASDPAASSAGSSSSGQSSATAITATEADFSIKLASTNLTAGSYTITVDNQGRATHNLIVEKDGANVAKSDTLAPGASGTVTVDLQPGSYVFYCGIGNHRAMGMEVTVNVS